MRYTKEFHNTITAAKARDIAKKLDGLKKAREVVAGVAMRSLSPAMFEQYSAKAERLSRKIWALEAELEQLNK